MRNFIKKLCPLFLGAVMLTGNIQSILASDESTETLTDLMIGCDEYKPYNYFDENGNLVGIDADLAEEACHRMRYEPVYVIMKWTEKEAYLDEQIIDCIWDSHSLNGREDSYLWSEPYMYSQESVIVNEDSSINSLDDLNDKNIATLVNTRAEDILLQLDISPEIYPRNIYSFQLMKECLTALRQGYVDAVAGDKLYLETYMKDYPGRFRILDESLETSKLAVAFSKDTDPELVDKLNETLNEMKLDGTIDRILEKYETSVENAS
nr:transporter substrate-binding domain-containing protein [uncultured Blautia sp.]